MQFFPDSDNLIIRKSVRDKDAIILTEKDQIKMLKILWKYRRNYCERAFLRA